MFNPDVFVLVFFNVPVYFRKKNIYCSSITVCLHLLTLVNVTESARDVNIINMIPL